MTLPISTATWVLPADTGASTDDRGHSASSEWVRLRSASSSGTTPDDLASVESIGSLSGQVSKGLRGSSDRARCENDAQTTSWYRSAPEASNREALSSTLEAERNRLVQRKYDGGGLTPRETNRLRYLEWTLDQLEASDYEPSLERLANLAHTIREFKASISELTTDLRRAAERPSRSRRQK